MAPLLALTLGFASGIFFRSFFVLGISALIFLGVLVLIFVSAWLHKGRTTYLVLALFFFASMFGVFRTDIADTPPPEPFMFHVGESVSYEGVVVKDPDLRDSSQRVTLRVHEEGVSTKILVVTSRTKQVQVGERVRVYGKLTLPEPFESEGGRTFRYDRYLAKDGVRFMMEYASLSQVTPAPNWSIAALFARVKHTFVSGISLALPEPYAALGSGMVIGGKQGLGSELLALFTIAGIVHIVVLSGYNVMIIAEGIMAGLSRFRISRKGAGVAGAIAIVVFVCIVGGGSATFRAALMAMIALYARASGRTYAASRALLVVVLLMLVWNPLLLVFDPGFDLSVVATAGLIFLAPLLEMRFTRVKNLFLKNIMATTLAAQIAVLPLLLYQTGNLSLVAIPANLLVLPVMPLAMAFSAIAGFAGVLFSQWAFPLTLLLSFPAYLINAYIVSVARFAAEIPFAAFTLPAFPFFLVVVAYALLIWKTKREYTKNAMTSRPQVDLLPLSN